jgi:hypothetical protein
MNEGVQMAVLKLDGKFEWKLFDGFMALANNSKPMVDVAHVVVRHFKNKKI